MTTSKNGGDKTYNHNWDFEHETIMTMTFIFLARLTCMCNMSQKPTRFLLVGTKWSSSLVTCWEGGM